MHTVLVAGDALGVPAPPPVEQAAATRRDASEERAAPLKANNATISMSHLEMDMSVATTLPQIQPPRSDLIAGVGSDRTADSPIQELRGRELQIEPPLESCPDELTGRSNEMTGRAHAVREASLEPSSNESFRVPHTSRKGRRLTFFHSDDPAVARALQKQRSLPRLERTQGVASPREDTPLNWSNQLLAVTRLQPLARWPRTVRHNIAKRIAKGRELLRLPRLPDFDLAHSTALDYFFGGVDFYPAYDRF